MRSESNVVRKSKNLYHLIKGFLANIYFQHPSRNLQIVGVTGTDGKTTTSNYIYHILNSYNHSTGIISTLNAYIGDKEYAVGFHVTTPDSLKTLKFLRYMVDSKLTHCVLETTSHSLDQNRVYGVKYDIAVYTNITNEHLDYHKTYENYVNAKAKLIAKTKDTGTVVLNLDDTNSYERLIKVAKQYNRKVITYGIDNTNADIYATNYKDNGSDIQFTLNIKEQNLQIEAVSKTSGKYNLSNTLAAICATYAMGIPIQEILNHISTFPPLSGRWERIQSTPFTVIVDFAHTPNALMQALTKARSETNAKLIVVFGCAGLRDKYKREVMGEIAGKLADITYITAEDPRSEDINDINKSIEQGILKTNGRINDTYFIINDRKEAIKQAISQAKSNDLVLITGKGHEKSMNLDGKSEIPWSDQEIVKEFLNQK